MLPDWLIFAALLAMIGIDFMHHEHDCHCCGEVIIKLDELIELVKRLLPPSPPANPQSMTLSYALQGESGMSSTTQPLNLVIGQTALPTEQEWSGPNGTGSPVSNAGAVSYSADPSGAVIVDPNTGIVTAASATAPGAVATVTASDASNPSVLFATFTFIVTGTSGTQPQSMTLNYTPGPVPASAQAAEAAVTRARQAHPQGPAIKSRN